MLRYGYFDSEIIGYDDEDMPILDRAESSDFLALFISCIISNGVLARPGDCFQVIASGGEMRLKVRPGFGIIKGRFAVDTEEFEIDIPTAPRAYKRIDRVVLRANYLERLCEIVVKEGTPAARPEPPELLQPEHGDYYELCLATVAVNAGQTEITQSSITDTRYDSRVCGVVSQVIDHLDTSVFFAQLNKFYSEFVAQSNGAYDKFVSDMEEYLNKLKTDGDSQLGEIVKLLTDFEVSSEQQWQEWFDGIRQTLTSIENGKMLEEIRELYADLYRTARDRDIDAIIEGTYVDEDEEMSILEIATEEDIDAIINGTYVYVDEEMQPDIDTIISKLFVEEGD